MVHLVNERGRVLPGPAACNQVIHSSREGIPPSALGPAIRHSGPISHTKVSDSQKIEQGPRDTHLWDSSLLPDQRPKFGSHTRSGCPQFYISSISSLAASQFR